MDVKILSKQENLISGQLHTNCTLCNLYRHEAGETWSIKILNQSMLCSLYMKFKFAGLMLNGTLLHGRRTNLLCNYWYQLCKLGHPLGTDLYISPRDHIVYT